jgi:hypothetical protein
VPLDAVQLRFLPSDDDAIAAAVGELLAGEKQRLGCLCRSARLARGVESAAGTLKLPVKRRPIIVAADAAGTTPGEVRYPDAEPAIAAEAWGDMLGRMLAAAARGERPDPYHVTIPVRLRMPE